MKLTSFSAENYLGISKKLTLSLDHGLTTVIGSGGVDLDSVTRGLSIFLGYQWPQPEDFAKTSDGTPAPAITFTARFTGLPEMLTLDRHSYFRLSSEYLLDQDGALEISRSFRLTREGLQERTYATAVHPAEPGLNDLLQVNNTILKRRLTNSTVSANAVDRRCNSAIRHALWEHSVDLDLRRSEVSLCRGDAQLIWQALQLHFPILRVIRGKQPGHPSIMENALARAKGPHANLVRVAPRQFASHRSQDLSLLEPSEMYDLPLAQQWTLVPPQLMNKTEPPSTISAETFMEENGRFTAGASGINHLYCVQSPDRFADAAVREQWIARLSEIAAQEGNMVILAVNLPTPLTGLPTEGIRIITRTSGGVLECIDERPVEDNGIPQVSAPAPAKVLRASHG